METDTTRQRGVYLIKTWWADAKKDMKTSGLLQNINKLEMWANAQCDGRPAKYRWRPLFNRQSLAEAHYESAVQ